MSALPEFKPALTEVANHPEVTTSAHSGTRFPVKKLACGRLVVDAFSRDDDVVAVLWDNEDHPNLGKLPVNAPKRVKQLYKAPGQLAQMRSMEYPNSPYDIANKAWREFKGLS